jgi:hypothetical protein
MNIKCSDNEVLITGNKEDLLEFAEYINKVANSENEKDHLHLDDLTIVDKDSEIKNLIIEKI